MSKKNTTSPAKAPKAASKVLPKAPATPPVNNAITAPDNKARIGELWNQLNDAKGNRLLGKKLRRALRALGHRGGLTQSPTI